MLRNFIWAFMEKGGQFFLQFVSIMILSRILTPSEYGIYGIMTIFIAMSEMLIDSGLGGAIVQKKIIVQADIDTLFTLNISVSSILYLILFICSPFIANYYNLPELTLYLRVLGITIIAYSLTIIHSSLLQRELKFKVSAKITIAATLISICVSIFLALNGMGIWAIIIQQVLISSFMAIFYWVVNKRRIRLKFDLNSFMLLWKFGSNLLFANILRTFVDNITTSIIPKIASYRISGLYYQASRLNSIACSVSQMTIDKAVFPILSKQEKKVQICNYARVMNRIVMFFAFPAFLYLSLFSKEIITQVLGQQWSESAIYLSILAWGGSAVLLQVLYRNMVKSIALTRTILKVDICKSVITLLVLIISIKFGVMFMVVCFTINMFLGALFYAVVVKKEFGYVYKEQLQDIIIELACSLCCYVSFYYLHAFIPSSQLQIFLIIPYYAVYILLNYIMGNKMVFELILNKITKSHQ